MARTRKRSLWVAPETGGYNEDPDTDGTTFRWVPAFEIGALNNDKKSIPTDYKTGRNFKTRPITGPDAWSFDVTLPWIGLPAAAGNGATPSATQDWLDMFLLHICGTAVIIRTGRTLTSATADGLVLSSDSYNAQDLIPVYENNLPSAAEERTQWVKGITETPAGTFTSIEPDFEATPTAAAVAYGSKIYTLDDDGGDTLEFIYQDDDEWYLLNGGRVTAAKLSVKTEERVEFTLTIRGNTRTVYTPGSKADLPAAGAGPAVSSLVGIGSPVYFNGTEVITKMIEFDFGIDAGEPVRASRGANGRSADENLEVMSTLAINPVGGESYEALQRDFTTGGVLIQIGAGAGLVSGALNTTAISIEQMTASKGQREDDGKRRRVGLTFEVSDTVTFRGTAALSTVLQIARA